MRQTALTRCVFVPCACLLLPPLGTTLLTALRLMPASATARLVVDIAVIYACLRAALPAALAIYPQTAVFDALQLEDSFHTLLDADKRPIRVLYANKGL